MAHILLIDDDDGFGDALVQLLTQDRHRVTVAHSTTDSLPSMGQDKIDLIVTGILVESGHGLAIIAALARIGGRVPVIALPGARGLMSAEFSFESALLMGIKVNVVRHFVRADIRQAIAEALG